MFGLTKKTEVTEPSKAEMEVLKPKPHLVLVENEPLNNYEEIAERINFFPAAFVEQQLLTFLAEMKIEIFNYEEVGIFLKQEASKVYKHWCWRPLRAEDKPFLWWYSSNNHRPYDKAIPIEILERVEVLEKRFPGRLGFFVSDYAVPNPDPFIMVTAVGVSRIIFGVWDEPMWKFNK